MDVRRDSSLPRGLLIVGHGTRDPEGAAQFLKFVATVASGITDCPVRGCYLERQSPSLAEGLDQFIADGAREICVAPLLLFDAGHAKCDIPAAIASVVLRHRGVSVFQSRALGCHVALARLSVRRFYEALTISAGETSLDDTMLVLVGRGSRDPEATAEMHRFAGLRNEVRPVGGCELTFTAMAEPRVEEALARAAQSRYQRVVVQPHLLFQGELSRRVAGLATEYQRSNPTREWLSAGVLGCEPEVIAALQDRIAAIRFGVTLRRNPAPAATVTLGPVIG